ncbi:helix-turn-helix domain-containing protein [Streptomyces sp. NPDC001137]|uniref:helix-turn-helix domain-containing protein n=1 Tax=Streptomyces sp. NPDC001137 TaxID=3154378 RepID=UPI00331ACE97
MPDSSPRELSDIGSLKALAHPLRQQMFAWLQRSGPATSAELAAEFGADRGATSYHLRQLARYGFIEEDTSRSTGRRRYWRAPPQDLRIPRRTADSKTAGAVKEVFLAWLEQADDALRNFLAASDSFGEFAEASQHSLAAVTLTAEELVQFGEDYMALLKRWQLDEGEQPLPGARHITVLFHAFPTIDEK